MASDSSHPDEQSRLSALRQFSILDTLPEHEYEDVVELASFVCGTPIALVSMVDADRQWFKAARGLDARQTPREQSFCAHTIPSAQTLIVEDAANDPRFKDNPLVLGNPNIRFYAGAPIIEEHGNVLGTVCVIDTVPRTLSTQQISALEALSRQVVSLLMQRKQLADKEEGARKLALTRLSLSRTEERFSLAVEAADLATWFYDPDREVVGGDDRMGRLFGVELPEGPADVWLDSVHPDDRTRVAHEFAESIAGAPYDTEYRLGQDGSVRWVRAKARLIKGDGHTRMVGICEDVTSRKITESALAKTAERLRLAQSASKIATWEWDMSAGAIFWTEGSAWVYGRPPSELTDFEQVLTHVHPEDLPSLRRKLESVLSSKAEFESEFRVVWPDGTVHWAHALAKPIFSEAGETIGMTGINIDVTERKIAEQVMIRNEKLSAVGQLASTIAHEINNPLEAVTNLLFIARQDTELTALTKSYLDSADAELRRTASIVNRTLRFHKQSTGPIAATWDDLVSRVLGSLESRLKNAGVTVEKRRRSTTPVLCFDGEIRQVIANLVGNAVDAMQRGGGSLFIRSRNGHDWKTGRHGLFITIADTGTGMSAETQKKLFQAFYTTKGIGGTGLGLWISCEIMERHRGRLRVRSSQHDPYHGAVFVLFLPFVAATR